jgi:LysM repeat protein
MSRGLLAHSLLFLFLNKWRVNRWRVPRLAILFLTGWMAALLLIMPASAQEGGGFYYRVQPGDSWTSVARQMGLSVGQLQAVNPEQAHPEQWLFPGQTLFIPVNFTEAAIAESYTVQPGDSWYKIAEAYGLPVRALWAANPKLLRPHLLLRPGDVVMIPAGGSGAAPQTSEPDDGEEPSALLPADFLREGLMALYGLSEGQGPQIHVLPLDDGVRLLAYTTGSLFAIPEGSSFLAHFAALYAPGDLTPLAQADLPELLAQVESAVLAEDGRTLLVTASYMPGGVFFLFSLGEGEIAQLYEGAGGRTVHTQLHQVGPERYGVLARYAPGGPIPQGLFTDAYLVGPVDGVYGEIYSQNFDTGALIAGVEPSPELAGDSYPTVDYRFVPGENPDYFDMEILVTHLDGESVQIYRFDGNAYVAAPGE